MKALPLRELPDELKVLLGNNFVIYEIKSDGACGPRAAALWLSLDQSLGCNLAMEINSIYRNNWCYWKDKFSFPFKAAIGRGKDRTFNKAKELLEFLRTDQSAYMWRGQEDFAVICTIYRLNIKIYKPDGSPPTVLVPLTDMPNPTNLPEGKVADLMILHEDECHFNLIVPRDGSLATEGGLDFQRREKVRLKNEEMLGRI